MKKFIHLLEFELGRFMKFLLPTIVVSALIQFISLSMSITDFNDYLRGVLENNTSMQTFSMQFVTNSQLYSLSILLIPIVFVFYSFFTWYREWLGKNTFIYRLLMLPMNRMAIFYAKALAFIVGGLLAFVTQFGLYFIQSLIFEKAVPVEYFQKLSIHNVRAPYDMAQNILFPQTGHEFLHNYGFAFAALTVLFTAILLERSFKIKGGIAGILYFMGYFAVYSSISLLLYESIGNWVFKVSHVYLIQSAFILIMIGVSSLISHFVLKNKVRV